jgi:hypothetical protein
MSRDDDRLPDPGTDNARMTREHTSRAGTESVTYERLRQQGVTKEHARRLAERSSEIAHRSLDRRATSRLEERSRRNTSDNIERNARRAEAARRLRERIED